jgi:4-amino-4-deoxy-L-arabinose transferase-like glycosyltransferase
MENEPAPSTPEYPKRLAWTATRVRLALGVLVVLHLLWLRWGTESVYHSADGGGYAVQARLIATHARTELKLESDVQYIGGHWMETPDGRYFCQYPPGFPLLQAVAYFLFGPAAALWLASLLAMGLLILLYFLAREFMAPVWALAAAAVMAVNGVANGQALQNTSHSASVFFLILGLYWVVRFTRAGKLLHGSLGGLALGVVPTIRYGDSIVAIGIVVYLLRRCRPWWRAWPIAAGSAAPILALMWRNSVAFGRPWRTGYSLLNEETAFSFHNFRSHLLAYAAGLQGRGLQLFVAFGLAGIVYLLSHSDRNRRDAGLLFLLICFGILTLYTAFYFSGGPPERYFMPAFPLMIVAAVALLAQLADTRGLLPVAATVLAVQLAYGLATTANMLQFEKAEIKKAALVRDLVAKYLPPGQVLTSEQKFLESLDYTERWRLADDSFLRGREIGDAVPAASAASGQPWFRQRGKTRLQRTSYAQLPPLERAAQYAQALSAWSGTRSFFWLGPVDAEHLIRNSLATRATIERVADLALPLTDRIASSPPLSPIRSGTNLRSVTAGRPAAQGAQDLVLLRIIR